MKNSSQRPPASPAPGGPPRSVGLADLAEARALYAQLDPAWFDVLSGIALIGSVWVGYFLAQRLVKG